MPYHKRLAAVEAESHAGSTPLGDLVLNQDTVVSFCLVILLPFLER